ncbi:type I-E CRISPR-associated protein Cas5/CasD [Maritimibacter sp. 55A14]|uniref:type I-E CRISPR-associated protein Cas5/CasD n=1 Tax=Maritimibacter sp. 55A14 TaxID=2174844 RepID=UPI000D619919|nr:type I-E CRISPR-associated protein Cas5/CasD [Maritimibacter sp. 55A14]PWE32211.1 type I-E CRISPR-associated protein Cas5/CasD [Maritimibacter sp. 55A14]
MTDYLVFTLSATIGAMGDLAGHERRGSHLWPGRSAVTGLLGAALGLRREDDFSDLDELGLAVAPFVSGSEHVVRDYHTVETVPSAKARHPNSRPEALRMAGRTTNTTITLRDYRTGLLFGVALWGGGKLEHLRAALEEPVFALYFGRKSCPLSAPVAPRLISERSPEAALAHVRLPYWQDGAFATHLITDFEEGDTHIETRHDCAVDREKWHFAARRVAYRPVDIRPET